MPLEMLLDRADLHLMAVKNTGGQGGFRSGGGKDLGEVLHPARPAGGDHRDGRRILRFFLIHQWN